MAFVSTLGLQILTEGLDNPDWNLWSWGPMLLLSATGYLVILNTLPKTWMRLIAIAILLMANIKFDILRVDRLDQSARHSMHRDPNNTTTQIAYLLTRYLNINPNLKLLLPFPGTPVCSGGFDFLNLLSYKDFRIPIETHRIKFFPIEKWQTYAKTQSANTIMLLSETDYCPPIEFLNSDTNYTISKTYAPPMPINDLNDPTNPIKWKKIISKLPINNQISAEGL
jgi:hypothetical protein